MTPQEVRDKLAELAGFRYEGCVWCGAYALADKTVVKPHYVDPLDNEFVWNTHPIPANSIDALLPLWPDRWWWRKSGGTWAAGRLVTERVHVPDTGNEADDRARLTLAVNMEARK